MHWFLLFLLPSAAFGLLAVALPGVGPTPRWRVALRGWRDRTTRRLRGDAACDPFEVLHLQTRLAAVAQEVRLLTADSGAYARAHRLRAALAAYDDLLAEACRVAGVPQEPAAAAQDVSEEGRARQRLRVEMELSARSWHW